MPPLPPFPDAFLQSLNSFVQSFLVENLMRIAIRMMKRTIATIIATTATIPSVLELRALGPS